MSSTSVTLYENQSGRSVDRLIEYMSSRLNIMSRVSTEAFYNGGYDCSTLSRPYVSIISFADCLKIPFKTQSAANFTTETPRCRVASSPILVGMSHTKKAKHNKESTKAWGKLFKTSLKRPHF